MTTKEVAQILQVAPVTINNIKTRLNIPVDKDYGGNLNFSAENISAIKYYLNTNPISKRMRILLNKNKPEVYAEPKTLEGLKRLHPLVTDERCFILTWFPDTKPKCFQGLEEI